MSYIIELGRRRVGRIPTGATSSATSFRIRRTSRLIRSSSTGLSRPRRRWSWATGNPPQHRLVHLMISSLTGLEQAPLGRRVCFTSEKVQLMPYHEILDTIAYLRFSVCGLGERFTAWNWTGDNLITYFGVNLTLLLILTKTFTLTFAQNSYMKFDWTELMVSTDKETWKAKMILTTFIFCLARVINK